MTIFRTRGFDSLIGKGSSIQGDLIIEQNSTFQVDGIVRASRINEITNPALERKKNETTLRVNGLVCGGDGVPEAGGLLIEVANVIVSGAIHCSKLTVEGTLAVKAGATLNADEIYYRDLVIETGAIVHGQMFHLDHLPTSAE